jgi:RarD protein
VRAIVADRRRLRLVAIGSVLIAVNWGVFIWAVLNEHVLESSLGYFINPLVLIFLGGGLCSANGYAGRSGGDRTRCSRRRSR